MVARSCALQVTSDAKDTQEIFRALGRVAAASIPPDHNSCKAGPATVGDFLADFGESGFDGSTGFQTLTCKGSERSVCELSFGGRGRIESASRILRFEYDSAPKAVVVSSVTCTDVP